MNRDGKDLTKEFNDYIEHHGILGMKWGVRRTPEQLGHLVSKKRQQFDAYAEKSKIAGEAGKTKKYNRYRKKAERALRSETNLSKKLDEALRKQVEDDERVVQKGSIDDILAISDRLSDDQINRATRRIQNRQRLEGLKADEAKKLDKLVSAGKKVADISGSIYNISNNIKLFKKTMNDFQMDEIKSEKEKRKSELDSIVRKGNTKELLKIRDELSNTQMKDAYERVYLNNKHLVDRAVREKDEKFLKEYSYLIAYSPLYNKKDDKKKDDDDKKD